ncbi:MAG: glycoside hydrolase family 13 [Verrucomicrobia bacterium]|nr:glycoside hydrolase family 13 [Verrucomicrobiota bacterium]
MNAKAFNRKLTKEKSTSAKAAGGGARTIEVEFVHEWPEAREVYLSGSFNNWSCSSLPMRKDEKGVWRLRVPLTPGRHEYRYIVNGEWRCDTWASESVPNPYGSCNSVVEVTSAPEQPLRQTGPEPSTDRRTLLTPR